MSKTYVIAVDKEFATRLLSPDVFMLPNSETRIVLQRGPVKSIKNGVAVRNYDAALVDTLPAYPDVNVDLLMTPPSLDQLLHRVYRSNNKTIVNTRRKIDCVPSSSVYNNPNFPAMPDFSHRTVQPARGLVQYGSVVNTDLRNPNNSFDVTDCEVDNVCEEPVILTFMTAPASGSVNPLNTVKFRNELQSSLVNANITKEWINFLCTCLPPLITVTLSIVNNRVLPIAIEKRLTCDFNIDNHRSIEMAVFEEIVRIIENRTEE